MATKLDIYNNALGHIGERKLASLSEEVEAKRALDDHYSQAVNYALERGMWNFAKRTISTTSSEDVTPEFGYSYAFEKPDDWVRTMRIADNDRFDPILIDVQDEAGIWYTDCDPLYVEYVSNGATYGLNLSKWPPTFCEYIELSLARRICRRLTSSESKLDELKKEEADARKTARAADALNQPPGFPPTGSWITTRRGSGRVHRSRWNGSTL